MKLRLLPLAISAAVAMPGVALADGPTVYGKMNVTYEMADYDFDDDGKDFDRWELNSNASRLGFKGSEEITSDLSAIYKAEFGINVDDGGTGGSSVFSQRNIYVGLQGGWGTVQAGKFDTPLKTSQGKIDQFNDMSSGDISNVIVGERREANLIQYTSPTIAGGLVFTFAGQPGEADCSDDAEADFIAANPGQDFVCDDGPSDNFSASAVYSADMIYAALAIDDGINGYDTHRLSVMGMFDAFEVGAILQSAEESEGDDPEEESGFILSAAMKLGASNKLRAQYGMSETDIGGNNDDIEKTQLGLGIDHKLSKQSKVFANYILLTEELGDVEDEVSRLQLGVEHKF